MPSHLEEGAQCPGHRVRFVDEPAPREAHDSETGDEKVRVAPAVGFECAVCAVRAPTVRFGDEALPTPEEVDFVDDAVGLDAGVDSRTGKATISAQRKKAFLELAPGDRVGTMLVEQSAYDARSPASVAASQRVSYGTNVEEAERLGSVPGALDSCAVDDGAEVRERPRHRRAGNSV